MKKRVLRDIHVFNLEIYYKMNWKQFRKRLRKKRKKIQKFIDKHPIIVIIFLQLSIMVTISTVSKLFSSPPIKIEKKPEYEHRMYSDFIKGVKKNEIVKAEINPQSDIVYFEEKNGNFIQAPNTYGKLPRNRRWMYSARQQSILMHCQNLI